jgi:hypothetical protein
VDHTNCKIGQPISYAHKRRGFTAEWEKMFNPQKCFNGTITMRGRCLSPFVLADVVELLCSFNTVKEKLGKNLPWCWPVKWLRDYVNQFIELQRAGHLPRASIFNKDYEFGISTSTLTLKVSDFFFGIFNIKNCTQILFCIFLFT